MERIAPGEKMTFEVIGEPKPGGSKRARPVFRKDPLNPGRVIPVTAKNGMPIVNTAPDNSATKPWMNAVSEAAVFEWGARDLFVLDEPLAITLAFYFERPQSHWGSGKNSDRLKDSAPLYPETKYDVDKLERATLDALHGIVFKNDARVVQLPSKKLYGAPARCQITIRRFRALTVGDLRRMRENGEAKLADSLADQLALTL